MAGSPIESTIWNKPETVQPEILNVLIKMENKGKSPQTIESVGKALRKFAKNTDINNPDAVEKYIAKLKVRNGYKRSLCNAYKTYCDYYHIQWDKPKYQNDTQMFKCPTEQKLNLIIAGSHEDLALKLRISKDCGLRPIEIAMLKARDIDTDHRSITPTTAKHGAPRALPISDSLNTTLKTYININNIKPDEILFKIASHSFSHIYRMTRNGVAKKLNDQTIKSIRLYVFRHYFGTMTYRRTQSTAHTAYCMGHKNWKNTQVHVDIQEILNSVGDEFNTAVAKTIEEACKLIADGWTVACEFGEAKIFKKRK